MSSKLVFEEVASSGECQLLGQFGWCIQGALALLSMSAIGLKRIKEHPRRLRIIFLFDSSKQVIGALVAHGFNLLFASGQAIFTHSDPCNWYWVNITIDTTLGVLICYGFLRFLEHRIGRLFKTDHYETGYYGSPPRLSIFFPQLVTWIGVVICMKFVVLLIMILGQVPLSYVSDLVLGQLDDSPKLKLILVMILTPTIMNAVQFWVTDNIIMFSPQRPLFVLPSSSSISDRPKKEERENKNNNSNNTAWTNRNNLFSVNITPKIQTILNAAASFVSSSDLRERTATASIPRSHIPCADHQIVSAGFRSQSNSQQDQQTPQPSSGISNMPHDCILDKLPSNNSSSLSNSWSVQNDPNFTISGTNTACNNSVQFRSVHLSNKDEMEETNLTLP